MKKFSNLFQMKRIVTFVLAIAMVVTMVPTTAFAAEMPKVSLEQNEEVMMEESSEVTEDAALETTEAESVEEAFVEATEVTSEEAALVTVLSMELEDEDKTTVYTGYEVFTDEYSLKSKVKVTVDETEIIPVREDITFTWKVVGADGKLADLPEGTTAPVNAGTYNLAVKLAAREGQYKEAEIDGGVEFIVTPAKLYVTPVFDTVEAGSKVEELKVIDANVLQDAWKTAFSYTIDNPETAEVDESQNSHFSITYTVRDAFDEKKAALPGNTVLVTNGDYRADFVVAFTEKGTTEAAGNYEIAEVESQDLTISDLIVSYVNIEPAEAWKEAGRITHTYSGEPVAAPKNGTDFTVKVQYADGVDKEDKVVYADIADAKVTEAWYQLIGEKEYKDAEGRVQIAWEWVQMKEAPVDAGSYVYRLSYEGQDGIYEAAYKDIQVVIDPMPVVLVPQLKDGAVFYDEMTEDDVLAQIDYTVYAAEDMKKEIDVDKSTVWGTSYASTNKTQPYEPVFVLQREGKDEAGKLTYVENEGEQLNSENKYRVIFEGNKAVFTANGYNMTKLPINHVVNTTAMNYQVVTDYATVSANALEPVKVEKGIETTIDISTIVAGLDGAGESLENPFVTVFDQKNLYAKKEDYKLAVVKAEGKEVAAETDPVIEYRWYTNQNDSITDYIYDDTTNEPYAEGKNKFDTKEAWGDYTYNIPLKSGVYKLEITYKDKANPQYLSSIANVYYVIEKQPVKVALNGEYKAYIGERISDFIKEFRQEQQDTASVKMMSPVLVAGTTISGNEWIDIDDSVLCADGTDWTITYEVLETSMVEKTDDNGEVVKDAAGNPVMVPETNSVYHWCEKYDDIYPALDSNGQQVEENYEECYSEGSHSVFKENAEYKLTAKLNIDTRCYGEETINHRLYEKEYTDQRYAFEKYTIKKSDAEEPEVHTVREITYYNDKAPIALEKTGETKLSVSINDAKFGEAEKVYDGKPFDIDSFVKDAVIFVKGDGSKVNDVAVEYTWNGEVWNENSREYVWNQEFADAIDVGEYDLYVRFPGDDKYAPIEKQKVATVNITQATIKITPKIVGEVVAGVDPSTVWNNRNFQQQLVFEGVAERDRYDFIYQELSSNVRGYHAYREYSRYGYYYPVYDFIKFETLDEKGNRVSGVLRGEKTYTVKYNDNLDMPFSNNYKVECEEVSYKTIRGISSVTSIKNNLNYEYFTNDLKNEIPYTSVYVTTDGYHHTVTPINAIPYSYYKNNEKKNVYGNFLEARIFVPAEYSSFIPTTAMYKNAIEAVGGVVTREADGQIDFILDAGDKEEITFQIRWEDGYMETFTFDFTKAELMGNLAEAVAPKSIAFNTPVTQIAVGEQQNLDLKMTKVQMNDVVCIAYSVSDETVLSVDDYGKITALKTGNATVTATPVRVEDGEKVAIKGAKTASVKITVKPVTAPKMKKVTALDNIVKVQYAKVTDGYRREIYVLEGKKLTAADFEKKIAQMTNEQWEGIFAVAPKFLTLTNEDDDDYYVYDKKGNVDKKLCEIPVSGLSNNTDYTVYVRNVSAVRKAENGNNVTLSAQGSVKSFKTTKAQISYLNAEITNAYNEKSEGYYCVKLSDGKAVLSVTGTFAGRESDPSMDIGEGLGIQLPLNAEYKKTYVEPKLKYSAFEYDYVYNSKIDQFETVRVKSKLASVDKKGNVKLKGIGHVYISVQDENTKIEDIIDLVITATPTKVTGGKKKLGVGESVLLEDLLTYHEGKKKLTGIFQDGNRVYARRSVIIDEELMQAFEGNEYFALSENGVVTALKEGGKLDITLTDYYLDRDKVLGYTPVKYAGQIIYGIEPEEFRAEASSAKVTLTTNSLAPILNLKLLDTKNLNWDKAAIADDYAYVQFNYDGPAVGFKAEITDQRGRLIRSSYLTKNSLDTAIGRDGKGYYVWEIPNLTQQSKYKLTLTPRYGEAAGKTAKLSIKTTEIPASTLRVQEYDTYVNLGGLGISVMTDYAGSLGSARFSSGNTYTLSVRNAVDAISTGIDSLTWRSSNEKVATVKAVSGGFDAKFKALKAGRTIIEVKSKITKEVISRQEFYVNPVGDAYEIGKRYYEDNTPNGFDATQTISNIGLVQGQWSYINAGKETWVSYTAVKDGVYTFNVSGSSQMSLYTALGKEAVNGRSVLLTAKQPIYIKLTSNEFNHSVGLTIDSIRTLNALDVTKGLKVQGNNTMVYSYFTPQEDGVYELKAKGADSSRFFIYQDLSFSGATANGNNKILVNGEKGKPIYFGVYGNIESSSALYFRVMVSKFQPKQLTMDKELAVKTEKGDYEWILFTAPETNVYTFTSKKNDSSLDVDNYVTLHQSVTDSAVNSIWGDGYCEYQMQAGDKVYLKVRGNGSYSNADATLTVSKLPVLVLEKKETVEVENYNGKWYAFTAAETGTYMFSAYATEENFGSELYLYKDKNGSLLDSESDYSGEVDLLYVVEANQTLYVKVNEYYSRTTSLELIVTKVVTEKMEADKDIAVSLAENAMKFYEFTVPADGVYTFTTAPNAANDAADAQIKGTSSKNTEFELTADTQVRAKDIILTAGEIITLQVTNYDAPSAFVLNVTKKTIPAFTETQSAIFATVKAWSSFTAPEEGSYTFRAVYGENTYEAYNNFSYYLIDAQGVKREETYIYSDFYSPLSKKMVMKAGETIFWKVENAETYPVSLQVEKQIGRRVTLQAGEEEWIEFTAPTEGTYQFYSERLDSSDSYAELYSSRDESGYLVDDDDSNGNMQFRINYYLMTGQTVYLKVYELGQDEEMDIMVYITKQ